MMKLSKMVVATGNEHKVAEIQEWFAPLGINLVGLSQYAQNMPAETGSTFGENAEIKARYGYQVTGLPSLADDSGLEVDALAGKPGIYSSRYAGEDADDQDNNRKLLAELEGVSQRSAHFRCAMVLVTGTETVYAQGSCSGEILESLRGSGGFGYDPLFWLPELGLTMAQLDQQQKNKISHRGKALSALVQELKVRGWA